MFHQCSVCQELICIVHGYEAASYFTNIQKPCPVFLTRMSWWISLHHARRMRKRCVPSALTGYQPSQTSLSSANAAIWQSTSAATASRRFHQVISLCTPLHVSCLLFICTADCPPGSMDMTTSARWALLDWFKFAPHHWARM